MASYLRDITGNALYKEGVAVSTTSTTVTGSSQDFHTGDGLATAIIQVSALSSAATLTVYVEQSTDGTTFAALTNLPVTATGVTSFTFQRDRQYLRSYSGITSNKTSSFGVVLVEQLKTY